ncbi:MAG: flavodoxin family protein [Elusimicrobia bacterium]|nr:flavodoxin family protein [Elusimicrobiota bacterium]
MNTVIVYHSGYGHTKAVAEAVAKGAAAFPGAAAVLMSAADPDWDALAAADAIVFGTPTYMGSPSAVFKKFMEDSSKAWMERRWKDKVAAGFTISASQSGDKLNTLTSLAVFAAQHGMVWVGGDLMPGNNSSKGSLDDLNRLGSFLGLMAQGNADQGVEGIHPSDLRTAESFGRRVAESAARWQAGALAAAR